MAYHTHLTAVCCCPFVSITLLLSLRLETLHDLMKPEIEINLGGLFTQKWKVL